jgi:hypothetical protein
MVIRVERQAKCRSRCARAAQILIPTIAIAIVDIQHLYPPIKSLFFGPGAEGFESDLSHSYWEAASGKKVSKFIPNLLHLVFQNAIHRWLTRAWKDTPERATEELSNYGRKAMTRRGQQPDAIVALWSRVRLEQIRGPIIALRKSYKQQKLKRKKFSEQALWHAAERIASRDIICKALQALVDNKNIEAIFVGRRITENQVTLAILKAEFDQKYPEESKRRITLQKYLSLGGQIRLALAAIPRSLAIRSSS